MRDTSAVARVLGVAAARSASLMNARGMSADLGMDHKTVTAHTKILEDLFLVRRLQPWHANLSRRQVKAPKLYVTDTGLLSHLLNVDADGLARDARLAGSLFETFVAMELARQCGWSRCEPSLYHYRDSQQLSLIHI